MGAPKGRIPWNKGLTKETSEILKETGKKISAQLSGRESPSKGKHIWEDKVHPRLGKHWDIHPRGMLGKNHSLETRKKMSENSGQGSGEYNSCWRGGSHSYYHNLAREKFGKDNCEVCGMTMEEHLEKYNTRFDMHCTSIPKDYTIMVEDNWKTVCDSCHTKIEVS